MIIYQFWGFICAIFPQNAWFFISFGDLSVLYFPKTHIFLYVLGIYVFSLQNNDLFFFQKVAEKA